MTIHYDSQLSKRIFRFMSTKSEKDRLVKFTSVGVHKDDLIFHLNGHPINVLALKVNKKHITCTQISTI